MANAKQRKRKREKASLIDADTSIKPVASKEHRPVVPLLTTLERSKVAKKKFLTVTDGPAYHQLLNDHYQGFTIVPAAHVHPQSFHQASKTALEKLRDAGYYQYDMVMAGGKNLSRTFVQRTLVGEPGITYKYLGLRLFAHAWRGPAATTPEIFRSIYIMNQEMIRMTKEQLSKQQQRSRQSISSCCEYNLTLINYMEPSCDTVLREEESYGMGKASVSWHADSSLQDYSSIAVYHTLPTQRASAWDWKIALRKNPDDNNHTAAAAAAVQPVVVPTKSGDVYFLLGEFNHTHQHMVLAGSTARRISSTHRVAVTETDTYDYIRDRCSKALKSVKAELKQKSSPTDWNVQVILEAQDVLTEVEFEWIAQYWVQGARHDVQHVWWREPMRALEKAWGALEKLTLKVYTKCCSDPNVARELLAGLLTALKSRKEWRTKWDDRRADKIYKRRISRPFQPVEHPVFVVDDAKRLPKDLTEAISNLTRVLTEKGKKSPGQSERATTNAKPAGEPSGVPSPSGKRSMPNHASELKKMKDKKRATSTTA